MGTANYLGRVLTNNNPNDVRNCVSSRPNTFAFVDSGNSLVCVASDLGHVEAYSWVRLIEMRNHVYKVVWDLDHVLYRALNEIAHDASGSSMRRLATLEKTINELRWLSVHLELMLDGFEPRHVTTDFGHLEQVIQGQIDKNRGKARVAADLSSEGLAEIAAEERMQQVMADEALMQFEAELGLRSPETTAMPETARDTVAPTVTRRAYSAGTVAWNSSSEVFTSRNIGSPSPTRSPDWTSRRAITPSIGARTEVSARR